jgi:ABC-2 type transport system permease protein
MNFCITRIWTIVLRVFYGSRRDLNKLFELTYWPFIDILLFGFIGVSFATAQDTNLLLAFMSGLVLWQVAYRTNLEIARNVLQELWDNNLINFMASPLTIAEWLAGLMLTGLLCTLFTVTFGALCVKLMYNTNIFTLGWPMIVFALQIAASGWVLGLIAASFLMRWGEKIQTIVWAMGWLPAPFCSVYYPVEVLPAWAQTISKGLPMTYVFEALRTYIKTGQVMLTELCISAALLVLYFTLSLCLFFYMLNKRKDIGLASL